MAKILFIIAHSNIEQSIANKAIIEAYKKLNIETEYRELYKLYPDYKIDVKAEQDKLVAADVIVLQFPVHWYNAPSLLRKWFEEVLTYGFAYGSSGTALKDKKLIISFTTGSPADAYVEGGAQSHTLEHYMAGLQQLAKLCSMKWLEPVTTNGISPMITSKEDEYKALLAKLENHAKVLADRIRQ